MGIGCYALHALSKGNGSNRAAIEEAGGVALLHLLEDEGQAGSRDRDGEVTSYHECRAALDVLDAPFNWLAFWLVFIVIVALAVAISFGFAKRMQAQAGQPVSIAQEQGTDSSKADP